MSFAGGSTGLKPVTTVRYYKGNVGLLINQSEMINPDGCQRGEWYLAFGPSKLYGNGRFNHGIPFQATPVGLLC